MRTTTARKTVAARRRRASAFLSLQYQSQTRWSRQPGALLLQAERVLDSMTQSGLFLQRMMSSVRKDSRSSYRSRESVRTYSRAVHFTSLWY
jgi:hypothetical protein